MIVFWDCVSKFDAVYNKSFINLEEDFAPHRDIYLLADSVHYNFNKKTVYYNEQVATIAAIGKRHSVISP